MQINFIENLCFTPRTVNLKGPFVGRDPEIEFLFPEHQCYFNTIAFDVYDVREIMCEKVRAILTRRGFKARDFVDVYFIKDRLGVDPKEYADRIIEKTRFTLNRYDRYRRNLREKKPFFESGEIFDWGEEKSLLLTTIDEGKFFAFLGGFQDYLKLLSHELDSSKP